MIQTIIYAILGGFVPVLIWLWFWEHEDKNPEPKRLVLYAFIAGLVCVLLVIPVEKFIICFVEQASNNCLAKPGVTTLSPHNITLVFILWAATEEIFKYVLAYFIVLRRADNDEPIDSLMYMIVVALGFAALENTLFIFKPLLLDNHIQAIITGNFRFIGATALHTIASSVIGIGLALSFYKSRKAKLFYTVIGIILAITLHSLFNLSIIMGTDGNMAMTAFYAVWIGIVILLLFFEKIKHLKKSQ